MWLADLLPGASKVCPTCPTCKNKVGHDEIIAAVGLSYLSDLSDQKNNKVSFTDDPTPAQLAHARSLLVYCPAKSRKLHVWHCVRCEREMKCTAWRHIPAAELRFQRRAAGKTFSGELAEELMMEGGQ